MPDRNPHPQPNAEFYDIAVLYVAAERERRPDDPPFNPSFQVKRFVGSGQFKFFENGALVARTIPPEEDGVNFLPDDYPPYVVEPTGATQNGLPALAEYLSHVADAVALMVQLHGTGFKDEGTNIVYPAGETRRAFGFMVNGVHVNAGRLLGAKNARGVGHPGHWDASGPQTEPKWISDPDTVVPENLHAWGIPCRDLYANEEIVPYVATIFGMTYRIHRTDLAGPAPATGGLTALQEAKLDHAVEMAAQNHALLVRIAAAIWGT